MEGGVRWEGGGGRRVESDGRGGGGVRWRVDSV